MRIVLSGALPDPNFAHELTSYLLDSAPTLVSWFENNNAQHILADPAQTLCTALEYWQLLNYGFLPDKQKAASAGLGPFLLNNVNKEQTQNTNEYKPAPNENIWLLELVHMSPSRDGAALIPAKDLQISEKDSTELFESSLEYFDGTGFEIHPFSNNHWLIKLPENFKPRCPSPELVSISTVNEWWHQDDEGRPWRRLSNELQMLWFNNNVNQRRFDQQLMPINGVWLFGGGSVGAKPQKKNLDTKIIRSLEPAYASQDWGAWIQTLKQLEEKVFSSMHKSQETELVLVGYDRIVTLNPINNFWAKLKPKRKAAWKKWWSNQS